MTLDTLKQRLHDFTGVPSLQGQPRGFGVLFPSAARALTHNAPQELSDLLLCRVVEWSAQGNRLSNALKGRS